MMKFPLTFLLLLVGVSASLAEEAILKPLDVEPINPTGASVADKAILKPLDVEPISPTGGVSASIADKAILKLLDVERLNLTAVKTNVLAELSSNNFTGRGLLNFRETALPFVVKQLGIIECMGGDHLLGGNFFESIMGPGADFGGDYLCRPTCGGRCVPTQGLGQAPISLYYPFGCQCAPNRCDAHGPIIEPLSQPIFKVLCARDDRCTCESMGPREAHVGYLCNWINLNTHLPVSFLDRPLLSGYAPTYSPIRWCSCCPNVGFA